MVDSNKVTIVWADGQSHVFKNVAVYFDAELGRKAESNIAHLKTGRFILVNHLQVRAILVENDGETAADPVAALAGLASGPVEWALAQ